MTLYIGLDVHGKQSVYVAQDEEGNVVGEGKVVTTAEGFYELVEKLKAPEGTKIGLETGAQAMWVSRLLSGLSMEPVVMDAHEVRRKARRIGQKCDRRDALEICDGLRRGLYSSIVHVPSAPVLNLREILSRRRHFVKVCTMEVNGAKFVLRSAGLGQSVASLGTLEAWQKLLRRLPAGSVREYVGMHMDTWREAQEKVVVLEKKLRRALKPFKKTVRQLETTPGVGTITAATYVAVLATPERFPDSGRVVSYVGLAPSTEDTGERRRRGPITKRGSSDLRAMLCECAHHAARRSHPLNPYWVLVCSRQGYKRAVIAVAQRLARILYQMWRKGEEFDVEQLNVVKQRRTVSKTYHWRIRKPEDGVVVVT
jgi:transposase